MGSPALTLSNPLKVRLTSIAGEKLVDNIKYVSTTNDVAVAGDGKQFSKSVNPSSSPSPSPGNINGAVPSCKDAGKENLSVVAGVSTCRVFPPGFKEAGCAMQ